MYGRFQRRRLGWKKGIAADRIVESTVVIFEIKGEEVMILYDKISCFCFFWGFLCHLEKSYESKFEVGVPSGNSTGSSTGRLKNNDSLVVPYGPLDVQMPEAVSVLGKHAAEQSTAAMQANDHKVSVSALVYVSSDCRGYNFGKGVSSYGELPYASRKLCVDDQLRKGGSHSSSNTSSSSEFMGHAGPKFSSAESRASASDPRAKKPARQSDGAEEVSSPLKRGSQVEGSRGWAGRGRGRERSNEDGKKKQRTTPNRSTDPAAAAVQPRQTQ